MKLLHIDSSITGANSASRQLSAALVAALKAAIPGLEVIRRDEMLALQPVEANPSRFDAPLGSSDVAQLRIKAAGIGLKDRKSTRLNSSH